MNIREKIRGWLGINDIADEQYLDICRIEKVERHLADVENKLAASTSIGVDVHFKNPHKVIIFSELNGGQIRTVDVHFESIKDLRDFVDRTRQRYGAGKPIFDAPLEFKRYLGY